MEKGTAPGAYMAGKSMGMQEVKKAEEESSMHRMGLVFLALIVALFAMTSARFATMPATAAAPYAKEPAPPADEAGGLGALDGAMKDILTEAGFPGAVLAVAREGRLVMAKGYGLADLGARAPMTPESRFLLASVSKSITAAAILRLVDEGRLHLDDHPFVMLGLKPLKQDTVDERIYGITVRDLLHHAGGWDRRLEGDPINWSLRVHRTMGVPLPITADQLICYMLGQSLDFMPGSRQAYANLGYVVLGQVIVKVTGRPYREAMGELVLVPMGMRHTEADVPGGYMTGEVKRYKVRSEKPLEGGLPAFALASAGWVSPAHDMIRFLTSLDGSRTGKPFLSERVMAQMLARPSPPLKVRSEGSWFGLGWDAVWGSGDAISYAKGGSLAGTSTWIEHMPGMDWVVLFNARIEPKDQSNPIAKPLKRIRQALLSVKEWPDGDLLEK
jgi:CubicO group peptidase (beta-lactamase class C family)